MTTTARNHGPGQQYCKKEENTKRREIAVQLPQINQAIIRLFLLVQYKKNYFMNYVTSQQYRSCDISNLKKAKNTIQNIAFSTIFR